jgi:hypothetical protein
VRRHDVDQTTGEDVANTSAAVDEQVDEEPQNVNVEDADQTTG